MWTYIKGLGEVWIDSQPPEYQRTNVLWLDLQPTTETKHKLLFFNVNSGSWEPLLGSPENPEFRVTENYILQYKYPSDADWIDIYDLSSLIPVIPEPENPIETLINPDANLITELGIYFCEGTKLNFPVDLNIPESTFILFVENNENTSDPSSITQTCLHSGIVYIRSRVNTLWSEWKNTNIINTIESTDFKYISAVYTTPDEFDDDVLYIDFSEIVVPPVDYARITITANPSDAIITINGIQAVGEISLLLEIGTVVNWTVTADGYTPQANSLILNQNTVFTINLNPIVGPGIGEMIIGSTFIVR